jgi:hypothetical protein
MSGEETRDRSTLMPSTELVDEVPVSANDDDVITPKPDVCSKDNQQSDPSTITIVVTDDNEGKLAESQNSSAPHLQNSNNEADGHEPKTDPIWQSAASVYCPKNGRPHSVLVDFGFSKCPQCDEDLRQPEYTSQAKASDANASEASDHKQDTHGRKEDSDEVDDSPKISYTIEYVAKGGITITSSPWGKPFDLQAARGAIEKNRASIFDVVTVVKTTIEEDRRRRLFEVRDIMEEGLLGNPAIDITVWEGKIVIKYARDH